MPEIFSGGANQDRTGDLLLAKRPLSALKVRADDPDNAFGDARRATAGFRRRRLRLRIFALARRATEAPCGGELLQLAKSGLHDAQLKHMSRDLGKQERLIWVGRCARKEDSLRQVALLFTTRRVIWCREWRFGKNVEGDSAEWKSVSITGDESALTLTRKAKRGGPSSATWSFAKIRPVADPTGNMLTLDLREARWLAEALAGLHQATKQRTSDWRKKFAPLIDPIEATRVDYTDDGWM